MVTKSKKIDLSKSENFNKSKKIFTKNRILVAITIILISFLAYGTKVYFDFKKMNDTFHEGFDTGKSDLREEQVDVSKLHPFSILLVGVDEDPVSKGPGRSDTMMVVTLNPKVQSTNMYSIPRDLRVIIPGYEKKGYQKFNNAYFLGGTQLVRKSAEKYLDIPIDHVLEINFQGFVELIDALGGITIENTLEFTLGGYDFPLGKIEMDGQKALVFSRMRKEDIKNGDFGRQERQKQVIKEIVQKTSNFSNITKLSKIFNAVENNVKTSLYLDDIMDIREKYSSATSNMTSLQAKYGAGVFKDKLDYVTMSHEERLIVINTLREHLELPIKDSSEYPNKDDEMMSGKVK
ncbi:MAG: trascriptional regulator [Bacillales bacterium]|jgi:LCP family protein required for cell wall assembly|nr:trascriptional regulator [Bacillales bacterium]